MINWFLTSVGMVENSGISLNMNDLHRVNVLISHYSLKGLCPLST